MTEYGEIVRILDEAATFFTMPGVIRGAQSLLLTQKDLQEVFDLSDEQARCFGSEIGLGYDSSHPVVSVGGKQMSVSDVRAKLAELHETSR